MPCSLYPVQLHRTISIVPFDSEVPLPSHPVYRNLSIVLSPLSIELYLELAPGNQHFLNIHANLTMLQLDINAFLKTVWAATKGERSVSTRSKWRANWGYNPTTIDKVDNASRKRKMDG